MLQTDVTPDTDEPHWALMKHNPLAASKTSLNPQISKHFNHIVSPQSHRTENKWQTETKGGKKHLEKFCEKFVRILITEEMKRKLQIAQKTMKLSRSMK